jgi:hypothetical protein
MHHWMLGAPMLLSPTFQDVAIGTAPWCVRGSVYPTPPVLQELLCESPFWPRKSETSGNRKLHAMNLGREDPIKLRM